MCRWTDGRLRIQLSHTPSHHISIYSNKIVSYFWFFNKIYNLHSTYSISVPAQKYVECRFISMTFRNLFRRTDFNHTYHTAKQRIFISKKWEKFKTAAFFFILQPIRNEITLFVQNFRIREHIAWTWVKKCICRR